MNSIKKILLVEDDLDDQAFFIEAISEIENASLIAIANNGKQALNRLENHLKRPDIIFMDINMPVMNGIDSLKKILENPETKDIPVVILSTATGQVELAQILGAKAFIKKPFDGDTLRSRLEEIISLDFDTDSAIASLTFLTAMNES